MRPRTLEKARLILGEGIEEERFLPLILEAKGIHIEQFQFLNFGGKYNLRNFLPSLVRTPGFGKVESLLLTLDADNDPKGTFQMARDLLTSQNLPAPNAPGQFTQGSPRTAVWVFPDNVSEGDLEVLCQRALENHPLARCVHQYLECASQTAPHETDTGSKAWVYTFLASQRRSGYRPGRRLAELSVQDLGSWNLAVFDQLINLICQM